MSEVLLKPGNYLFSISSPTVTKQLNFAYIKGKYIGQYTFQYNRFDHITYYLSKHNFIMVEEILILLNFGDELLVLTNGLDNSVYIGIDHYSISMIFL
jgi:hypothetical protein